MTHVIAPNAPLVQATADLLAARVALYKQQPGHGLIRLVDSALESLLSPAVIITSGRPQAAATERGSGE